MVTEPEITTLGEKGQVVIPQSLRQHLGLTPKMRFLVFGQGDVIVLKRLKLPDATQEWEQIFSSKKADAPSEAAVAREVAAARRAKRSKSG